MICPACDGHGYIILRDLLGAFEYTCRQCWGTGLHTSYPVAANECMRCHKRAFPRMGGLCASCWERERKVATHAE
jgi:DnaJ-class molecular chaperone